MTISYATYCIIDSDREVPEGIAGPQAGTVCNLPYRGIGAAVSSLAKPIQDMVAGAVAHEAVVERLMQTHTVLPMRFPTVFFGQEAVLAMMSQHYNEFREDLERLRNRVEFGVRVMWPADPVKTHGQPPRADRNSQTRYVALRDSVPHGSSGRQYMRARYRQYQCRQALREQAALFGCKLDTVLSEFATAKRLRKVTTDTLAFDGVYLVDKDMEAGFRRAFLAAKGSEPCFGYLLSGPWPPYNFVGPQT
jgi:hypothetical protein